MSTITTVFSEVSFRAEKSGKCIICGKRRKRAKKFWQTLNPFNKKADGRVKTPSDIREELAVDVLKWKEKPIDCCSES